MSVALIGLGTNQDREYNILLGIAKLLEAFRVTGISSVFATVPVGTAASSDGYFNSCVLAEVDCDPQELRAALRQIEADVGRVRTGDSPYRPLDLDILAFGPDLAGLEWFPREEMAAFVVPMEEFGIAPEPQPMEDAQAVCVWRRTDVFVKSAE